MVQPVRCPGFEFAFSSDPIYEITDRAQGSCRQDTPPPPRRAVSLYTAIFFLLFFIFIFAHRIPPRRRDVWHFRRERTTDDTFFRSWKPRGGGGGSGIDSYYPCPLLGTGADRLFFRDFCKRRLRTGPKSIIIIILGRM